MKWWQLIQFGIMYFNEVGCISMEVRRPFLMSQIMVDWISLSGISPLDPCEMSTKEAQNHSADSVTMKLGASRTQIFVSGQCSHMAVRAVCQALLMQWDESTCSFKDDWGICPSGGTAAFPLAPSRLTPCLLLSVSFGMTLLMGNYYQLSAKSSPLQFKKCQVLWGTVAHASNPGRSR